MQHHKEKRIISTFDFDNSIVMILLIPNVNVRKCDLHYHLTVTPLQLVIISINKKII